MFLFFSSLKSDPSQGENPGEIPNSKLQLGT